MSEDCCSTEKTPCCCSSEPCCPDTSSLYADWVVGEISTTVGTTPIVSTQLTFKDMLGSWKVRWDIGRTRYIIEPGLYAVGAPDAASPVLVSANYKLTFDMLRRELSGIDAWLLILDTKGINVWCAAGKGTFGSDELIGRIAVTHLAEIVSHRRLIVPQLGAPGVSASKVARESGFSVTYGPVRANDIKAYIKSNGQATEEMRRVRFTAWDRLILTPVELVDAARKSLPIFGVLFLLNLFANRIFGFADFLAYAGVVIIGAVVTPLLLPFIPGRAFAWKGWLLGFVWAAWFVWQHDWLSPGDWLRGSGYLLVLPAVSSYLAMKFTGSSTYTSFSGVNKEMRIAVPLMVLAVIVGSALLLANCFAGS